MEKTNILFITSDQHRADAMGIAGHPVVQTPNIDQLGYEGVNFTQAYSDCPVCIPARTTIITGRQAHHNGIPEYAAHRRVDRHRDHFLGSLLTKAGYQTELIGKTHWHTEPHFRAGFEHITWQALMRKEQFKKLGKTAGDLGVGFNELSTSESHLPSELQLSGWSCERAVEFLQLRDRQQPFFLWLSLQDPHPPLTIHEPYFSMYDEDDIPGEAKADWSEDPEKCPRTHFKQQKLMKTQQMSPRQLKKTKSVYYGMITHMDHQIGRVFGTLQYQKDWENTLIIYTSDHGEFLGDHGAGKKTSYCEASARVPFLVRFPKAWKEHFPKMVGTENRALVELADLLPFFCEVAGVRTPNDVDGKSLMPLLTGEKKEIRESLHGQIYDSHMWKDSHYKYLYHADDGSELLFPANDKNDTAPVALRGPFGAEGDLAVLDQYKRAFTEHLKAEGHEHFDTEKGEPVNQKLEKPSEREALSANGGGHAAIGWTEYDLPGKQELH